MLCLPTALAADLADTMCDQSIRYDIIDVGRIPHLGYVQLNVESDALVGKMYLLPLDRVDFEQRSP